MFELITFLATLLISVVVLLKLNKMILVNNYRILNPVNIYIVVWVVTMIVHYSLYKNTSYRNNFYNVYYIAIIGMVTFCLGFWLLHKWSFYFGRSVHFEYRDYNLKKVLKIFTVINLFRVVYMFIVVYKLAGSLSVFFASNTYVRSLYLRRATNAGTYLIELPLSVFSMMGYSILGILVGRRTKGIKSYLFVWTIFEFLMSVITMSKLNLFIYIFVLGVSILNNVGKLTVQKQIIKKYIPYLVIILVALLVVVSLQRNYSYYGNAFDIVKQKIMYYIASPLEAFGVSIESKNFQSVVDVGDGATNVFTWFRYFYLKAGMFGVIFYPFAIGMVASIFYDPQRQNLIIETGNSWVGCLIFMSYYSYLWSHKSYMMVIGVAVAVHFLFKNKIYSVNT